MCLEAGLAERGVIGCTQPRRVAAMSISRRVAEELKVAWGREVGCKMRFNDDTSRETQVKFMTDGILLAEIQSDPLLRRYSALIIDEAHERSLNIDFLLGYLQGLLKRRPDLKLIITSATIDTEAFSKAFGGAPIVEVSGRLYPVDIRYSPIGGEAANEDENFIEAAVRATEDALIESDAGDVLIFMPTERDIRETRDLLEGTLGSGIEVLGLYGRLPAGEQQRIFAPGGKRRVVVATNVAETSLTIPRIRYVIDSGLARMSRYSPRTRTKRLPIEAVSQSSANQRAGRAGRLEAGVCIRLYDQEDFEKRPRFTQPEIQRANLAEVVLRMKAFHLGEVETFPFLNPPAPQAIRAGYQLLHELGALSETHTLTPTGRELARLPVDPTLGRMLLQARREGALPEVLVIAAALSVPDPRERPEEAREAAAAAHRAFADPESDFITLLNIWNAAPATAGSRNSLRRFCKENFLSQMRMREWRDIHAQLADSLHLNIARRAASRESPASYEAIHRSILAGLLGQIAQKQERNTYKASANRVVTIFPGSGLYDRREKKKPGPPRPGQGTAEKSKQPEWLMAGEIVETSQLFARMVARIAPEWVVEMGGHLCKFSYTEPGWSVKAGRVLALERVLIYGLEILRRTVDYGRVDPVKATEIFIRGALVTQEVHVPHRFFAENRKLREQMESALTRVRSGRVHDLDEAFYRFYAARIQNVSSIHDLNQLVKERTRREPDFLIAKEADLLDPAGLEYDREMFPAEVKLANTVLPLQYAYTPGAENDGVTVRVPLPLADKLSSAQVQWMVPGLRQETIDTLLRALPKSLRKQLMPLEPKIAETVRDFVPSEGEFLESLGTFLTRTYRIQVRAEDWRPDALPAHLRPRIEVIDRRNRTVTASRDLAVVRSNAEKQSANTDAWAKTASRFEKANLTTWSIGDLPESVTIEEISGTPLLAYPGLTLKESQVDLRLFRTRAEAEAATAPAIVRLAELVAAKDVAWLQKELRSVFPDGAPRDRRPVNFAEALGGLDRKLAQPKPATATGPEQITMGALRASAFQRIANVVFQMETPLPLTLDTFNAMLEKAHRDLPLLVRKVADLANQILAGRSKVLQSQKRYPGLEQDVQRLVPADFLSRTPHAQLPHLVRYLKAMHTRAERAWVNPAKDAEKAKQLAPFHGWEAKVPRAKHGDFRWMLEELRVSLFAQELGTAQPISVQRLRTFGEL
jgi:ATP-dependent helicase HrpA